jgi:hypothetical protein
MNAERPGTKGMMVVALANPAKERNARRIVKSI